MKKYIFCLLLNTLLCSCPESFEDEPPIYREDVVWLINNCSEKILVTYDEGCEEYLIHPVNLEFWETIEPSDSTCIQLRDNNSSVSLQILILKQSTLKQHSEDEIINKQIVDKRYILIHSRLIEDGGARIVYAD